MRFFVPRRRPLEVFVHKSSRRAFQARADAACGQTMPLVGVIGTFAFALVGRSHGFFGGGYPDTTWPLKIDSRALQRKGFFRLR
jgi:hypothetical protein